MRKTLLTLLAFLMPLAFSNAQDKGISWGVDNVYDTQYIGFGLPFSTGPVWQPTIWGAKGNLSGFAMVNKDFDQNKFNEYDLGINYDIPVGDKGTVSVGGIHFPTDIEETWHTAGTAYAGWTSNSSMNPSLFFHRSYGDLGEGNYVDLSISKDYPLSDNVSVSSSTHLAYNDGFFRDGSGLSHFESNVGISAQVADNISVSGTVGFTNPLADDIEGASHVKINTSYLFR